MCSLSLCSGAPLHGFTSANRSLSVSVQSLLRLEGTKAPLLPVSYTPNITALFVINQCNQLVMEFPSQVRHLVSDLADQLMVILLVPSSFFAPRIANE